MLVAIGAFQMLTMVAFASLLTHRLGGKQRIEMCSG